MQLQGSLNLSETKVPKQGLKAWSDIAKSPIGLEILETDRVPLLYLSCTICFGVVDSLKTELDIGKGIVVLT